jgi:hypothetical protein
MADLEEDFAGDTSWSNDADNFGFGTGYLVKNHKSKPGTHTLAEINSYLSDSNIAIWAHAGHGSKGGLNLEFNGKVTKWRYYTEKHTNSYPSSSFKPHHKLAMGIFWTCYAGLQPWKTAVVSRNGIVLADDVVVDNGKSWYNLKRN